MNKKSSKMLRSLIAFAALMVFVLLVIGLLVPKTSPPLPIEMRAYADSKCLETAVVCFQMENGQLPESLEQLLQQINGNGPYISPHELLDPWDQKYQYSRNTTNEYGFVIWTISPENDVISNDKTPKSGKGECLAPPPHTTGHAGPHPAVRKAPSGD